MNNSDKSGKIDKPKVDIFDRTDFPSADAKYRALVEDGEKNIRIQDHLSDYTEMWALSYIEAEIFYIDLNLVHALYWAYERYESFIGSVDAFFEEYREQERIDYAEHYRGELVNEMPAAINFMVDACGLPALDCFGWVMKSYSAGLRGGLYIERQPVDQ